MGFMRSARTLACAAPSGPETHRDPWFFWRNTTKRRLESRRGTHECVRYECSLRNPRRLQYLCARVKLFERRQSSLLLSPSQLFVEVRLDYITSNRRGKLTEFTVFK